MSTSTSTYLVIRPLKAMYSGAKRVLAPFIDRYGVLQTGSSAEDIEKYEKATGNKVDQKFWHTFHITLNDQESRIEQSDANILTANLLKIHPAIAQDESQADDYYKEYLIVNELERASRNVKKREKISKAYARLESLSQAEQADILVLYGTVTDSLSPEMIKDKLYERIDSDPELFIRRANDEHITVKVLIEKLLQRGILRKNGPAIFYGEEDQNPVQLGANTEQAVDYLKNPKNQQQYINFRKLLVA